MPVTSLPEAVVGRFKQVLSLPPETLKKMNGWLKANTSVLTNGTAEEAELKSTAAELGLRKSDLRLAVSFVGSMTLGGFTMTDLEELGLADLLDKAKTLLDGIEIPEKEAEFVRQKRLVMQSVLPTLESVDGLCELRAIFGRLPSPTESEEEGARAKALIGFEPVALIGIFLNDACDNDTTCIFQVHERGLRNLIKTLQQLLAQVEVLKDAQKDLRGSKGAK